MTWPSLKSNSLQPPCRLIWLDAVCWPIVASTPIAITWRKRRWIKSQIFDQSCFCCRSHAVIVFNTNHVFQCDSGSNLQCKNIQTECKQRALTTSAHQKPFADMLTNCPPCPASKELSFRFQTNFWAIFTITQLAIFEAQHFRLLWNFYNGSFKFSHVATRKWKFAWNVSISTRSVSKFQPRSLFSWSAP